MSASKRLFFGLDLPDEIKQQIVEWRARHFPAEAGLPVAAANLHLPLAYLGDVSDEKAQALIRSAERIHQPAFTLTLDNAGHWLRSGAVWLGPGRAPRGLLQLADLLRSQAARSGCHQHPQPFHPHVMLLRQAVQPVKLPPLEFSWSLSVKRFVLFESHFARGRSQNREIRSWPLL